jgi:hypothetical protein
MDLPTDDDDDDEIKSEPEERDDDEGQMNNNWTEEMWVEQSNDGNDFRTNKSTMYVKQQSKIKFIHCQFTVFSIFI